MALTFGEIISNHLRFYLNIGSDTVALDQNLRARAGFFLLVLAKRVWDLAPFWFRLKETGTISLVLNDTEGVMPVDWSHIAEETQIYIQDFPFYQLTPLWPDELSALRRTNGSDQITGRPTSYTLSGRNTAGRPLLQIWPKADQAYTLIVNDYVKLMPDLVDRPGPPTAAVGTATGLTGVYTYLITFVTPSGETEAGVVSNTITLANQKGNLTAIPVSPAHSVTARKVYRTAAGGSTYGLVTTIADNTTTTFTGDALADGARGVAPPTVLTAITGTEQFPEDAIERLFVEGLRVSMATSQGDLRDRTWQADWEKTVLAFWGEYKQGRNDEILFPRYGASSAVGSGFYPRRF